MNRKAGVLFYMKKQSKGKVKSREVTAALLMAAGRGTRIRPLSELTPKPLIKVNGIPMIESIIRAIKGAGIDKIIITVGYKKESFYYLRKLYENIIFIENKEYGKKNTISSFYAAMNAIQNENCLVCESDLYIADPAIIKGEIDKSRYLLESTKPQNYEWGFHLEGGIVKKVVRPNAKVYLDHRMYGVAYWVREDLDALIKAVDEAYKNEGHEQKAYDEIGNEIFGQIDMGVIRVNEDQIYEIDTLDDLVKVDVSYEAYLKKIAAGR